MSTLYARTVTDSMFREVSLTSGFSSLRKIRSVATVRLLAVRRAIACRACAALGPQSSIVNSSSDSASRPSFSSSVAAIMNWPREASSDLGYFDTRRR